MLPLSRENSWIRVLLGGMAVVLLASVYVFQDWGMYYFSGFNLGENTRFILSKTLRFLINDLSCLMLIAAVFNQSSHLKVGWWLFLVEAVVLLPVYFALKLSTEGTSEISSPLLSQLHRMIVNPLLMLALLAGLLIQKYRPARN